MNAQEWYEQTYCSSDEYTAQDLIEAIKDPSYRMPGWVPEWDEAEFKRAQLELTAELRQNGLKVEKGYFNDDDPRLDHHWRDDNWDDVLLDQWWRYVAKEYHKAMAKRLIDNGILERVDIPRQTH